MSERLVSVVIASFTMIVTVVGLMFIAYQTLRVVQIAQEITLLILKTHP